MTDHNRAYADACERCGQYDVIPAAAIRDGDTGIVCGYRCPNCHAVWTCGWGIVPGRTVPPEPAAADFLDRHLSALLHEQAAVNRAHKHAARRDPA
ncbi:hypothetical protein ACH492_22320 [Streptomyces sp. NPDC019443]|uniref:hypothetical protein n=1 Tax=Streptomyces sp. NPDC019443 TaxID=3365061 RepID=UPI00378B8E91